MGVMTSKDMADRAKHTDTKSGGVNLASPISRKMVLCVRFDGAPKEGKCNAAFFLDGKSKQVVLKDQVYHFKDEEEKRAMLPAMLKAGFEVIMHKPGEKPKVEKPENTPTMKRYAHPDNEPSLPKEGSVSFTLGRGKKAKEHKFVLDEFGTVFTDDTKIQKHLEKLGWINVTVPPGEEG